MTGAPSLVAVVVGIVMVVGLAGTLVPLVPGLPLIWASALAYGLVEGFGPQGAVAMSAITVLLMGGVGAKFLLARKRAVAFGAPGTTIAAGALAGMVGLFVIPFVGFFVGAVLGVIAAERRRLGEWASAWNSTRRVIAGFGVGVVLEIGAGVVMIGAWALWVGSQG